MILQTAGHNPRDRLAAVTYEHFFAVPHELDMSAELRLEITDIYCFHANIIANMTMLVISMFGYPPPMCEAWVVGEGPSTTNPAPIIKEETLQGTCTVPECGKKLSFEAGKTRWFELPVGLFEWRHLSAQKALNLPILRSVIGNAHPRTT